MPTSTRFPVRYVKARDFWEVDVRPYGRIGSITFPGSQTAVVFKTKEMADEVRRIILKDIERGVPEKVAVSPYLPRETHVEKIIEAWLKELERRVEVEQRSPNYTRRLRSFQANQWRYFAGYTIHGINHGLLSDWCLEMQESGAHPTTIVHAAAGLRTALQWHAKRSSGLYVCPEFPELHRGAYVAELLSPEQQNAVLEGIEDEARGIFLFLCDLMARPGEGRALKISQYDFKAREFTLESAVQGGTKASRVGPTKGRDVRVLVATDRLAQWIEAHVSPEKRLKGGILFERPRYLAKGKDYRWAHSTLREWWARARDKVEGCPKAGLYAGTKHSTATWLRQHAGFSLEEIGLALGHAHARREQAVTEGYAQAPRVANLKISRILDSRGK